MKKLINDKNNIVEEVVQGMIKAFPDKVSRVKNEPIIIRKNKKTGKDPLSEDCRKIRNNIGICRNGSKGQI